MARSSARMRSGLRSSCALASSGRSSAPVDIGFSKLPLPPCSACSHEASKASRARSPAWPLCLASFSCTTRMQPTRLTMPLYAPQCTHSFVFLHRSTTCSGAGAGLGLGTG
eukprot:scaffold38351_cov63-Phaeocystis_antarctica.AAC.17